MSKELSKVHISPILSHILQEELPTHYMALRFNPYDSTRDLVGRLYHYQQVMALVDVKKDYSSELF